MARPVCKDFLLALIAVCKNVSGMSTHWSPPRWRSAHSAPHKHAGFERAAFLDQVCRLPVNRQAIFNSSRRSCQGVGFGGSLPIPGSDIMRSQASPVRMSYPVAMSPTRSLRVWLQALPPPHCSGHGRANCGAIGPMMYRPLKELAARRVLRE